MFVTVEDIPNIANEYLVSVIVPKMPSDLMKFGLSFCAGYIGNKAVNTFLANYGQFINMMGIIDNGRIDVELLKDNAIKALHSCPGKKFQYMGYVADEDDVSALYNIMLKYAK